MASSSSRQREPSTPISGRFFQPSFVDEPNANVVLDFDKLDADGNPTTPEGLIKRAVLPATAQPPDLVAIHGPGGVGKSVIARALASHPDLRSRFPDGVYLIPLGVDATPATVFQQLCVVLRDSGAVDAVHYLQAVNDVDTAIQETLSWFRERSCAFFIDDVWTTRLSTGLISRLCKLGTEDSSTVVLTTREADVASFAPPSERLRVNPREPLGLESHRILFCHAGLTQLKPGLDAPDGAVKEVLNVCGGLPVCLAAAGKGARMAVANPQKQEQDPWTEYILNLPHLREQLLDENLTDYGNIHAAFAASLALLENQRDQKLSFKAPLKFPEMYRRLCVLQKQAKVPASMLRHLWELERGDHAKFIGDLLVQVGMAENGFQICGPDDEKVWFLRIHDTLHDFAVAEATRQEGTAFAHEVLLDGYRTFDFRLSEGVKLDRKTRWWLPKLRADGYIHQNLCRHLKGAGQLNELVDLLETPWWIRRQLDVNDIWALQDDFATGISAVLKANEEYDTPSPDETVLRLIREALALSFGFISRNHEELWFQLYGRLLGHQAQQPRIKTFLNRIRQGVKERWLRSINPFLEGPGTSTMRMIIIGASARCMTVLPGTECVACGCDDGRIVIVNVMQGIIERSWRAHDGMICSVASDKRGTKIVSGGTDNLAKVWRVNTGNIVVTCCGHSSRVNSVATCPDGEWAVSTSEDGTVQVWHMETGQIRATFVTQCPARRVTVFPDGHHLVVGGSDDTLRVWNTVTGTQIGEALPVYNKFMNYAAVTSDGARIISGSQDEMLIVQTAKPLEKIGDVSTVKTLIELDVGVECVSLSDDCKYIVSGHANGRIRLWDAVSGNPIGNTLEGHTDRVRDISFLGSSDVIVSVSCDGQIRVWDVFRMLQFAKPAQDERITKAIFTWNGAKVITGSKDGSLRIWETDSGRQVGETLSGHEGSISDLALSPDERHLISVTNERDRTVRVWDINGRKQIAELGWHTGWVSSVALGQNGDHAIAGSLDKNVYLWDLKAIDKTGFFSVLKGHTEWVQRVYVSADGERIISVSDGNEIFLWDIRSRRCLKKRNCVAAWQASTQRVMQVIEEVPALHASNSSYIPSKVMIADREVLHKGTFSSILGTMECEIKSQAFYPHKNTFCIGLKDGRMALLQLENPFLSARTTETGEGRGQQGSE